jgi:hypothetical protein
MSLPRYTMCRDSGMEWLGEVPSDWDVRRIRFPFQIKKRIADAEGYDGRLPECQLIRVGEMRFRSTSLANALAN